MNILLVYPRIPATFWSFEAALKFISKKSNEPPLGLLTIASMLPADWKVKLIDMNVSELNDEDIKRSDFVFLSGMNIQMKSFREVVRRCNILGTKIVAGGPLATSHYNELMGIDHFILKEAELSLLEFINDLKQGTPKYIYACDDYPDIERSPIPMWELLDMKKYASMSIQYSRGCPYDCEFCSITMLNGRKPRTKSSKQFLNELDTLHNLGWKGSVSVVDDNFIGNKKKLKSDILPALIEWSEARNYPFNFLTEVSINLADDEELIDLLVKAGFDTLFIGIETPYEASLDECGKRQNLKRNLLESVQKLQKKGLIVSAGFIVGFDSDKPSVFNDQIDFIKTSGIISAMVGLLNAPVGTKLYNRLKKENRIIETFTGNNMDGSMNFIPKMNYSELIKGYSTILKTIYSDKEYYQRIKTFLRIYTAPKVSKNIPSIKQIIIFIRLVWKLGIKEDGKFYFWDLVFHTLRRYPEKFITAMTLSVYGFHFKQIVKTL